MNNDYVRIALLTIISIAILYAIMRVIDNIGVVSASVASAFSFVFALLTPVLFGFIIAFLLDRPADYFNRLLHKMAFFKCRPGGARVISVLVTLVIFLVMIALFIYAVVPGIIHSVDNLTKELPGYISAIDGLLSNLSQDQNVSDIFKFVNFDISTANSLGSIVSEFWEIIVDQVHELINMLFSFLVNTGMFIYNFILGIFFSIYMLIFKNQVFGQLSKLSKIVLRGLHYRVVFFLKVANDMFYRFLVGKGLCSLVVGVAVYITCIVLGFKHSILISVIIAVTNMVPTFGPIIGSIPATLLAMMTAPVYGLYMLIIIGVIQFVDAHILCPKVLGNFIGINGFWIIFSIIVMGGLFGIMGMLIATPLFGLIRILIKNWLFRKNNTAQKLDPPAEYAASIERYRQWTCKKHKKTV